MNVQQPPDSGLKVSCAAITALVAGILACLSAGTLFGVSAYAPTLKLELNLTQTEINTIGSVGDFGLFTGGLTFGLLYDATAPWLTMGLGSLLIGLGYVLMGLAVLRTFWCPWYLFALFALCVGQGSFGVYTAGYAPSVFNFPPHYRGRIMSVMLAGSSASAMIFSAIFEVGFQAQAEVEPAATVSRFFFIIGSSIAAITFICAFLVRKVAAPVTSVLEGSKAGELAPLVSDAPPPKRAAPAHVSPLRVLLHFDFYLVFGVLFLLSGPGLLWINVQGEMMSSLGDALAAPNCALAFSGANVAARVSAGFVSDAIARRRWTRAVLLIPASVLMGAGHMAVAFAPSVVMAYVVAVSSGLGFGLAISTCFTLMTIIFGTEKASTKVGLVSLAPALAGVLYGLVNGQLYAKNVPPGLNLCFGNECFQWSMVLTASSATIALLLSIALAYRTRSHILSS